MKEGGRLVSRLYRRATEGGVLPVADPFIARPDNGTFVLFRSRYNRLAIREAEKLGDLAKAKEVTIFKPDRKERLNQGLWAPEGHVFQDENGQDRWYVPVAMHDGDSEHTEPVVLESQSPDPRGPYVVKNMLTPGVWGIDQTYFQHNGQLYALWSGRNADGDPFPQTINIAPMENPWTVVAEEARVLSTPEHSWEFTEEGEGINEGPQVRQRNGRTQLIFSAGPSWMPEYVMGVRDLVGDDVMDPESWRKRPTPIHRTNRGHGHTIEDENGIEMMVSGAKLFDVAGWERKTVMEPASNTTLDQVPQVTAETEVVLLRPKILQVAGFTSPSQVAS